jgi:hypothetical protein
MTSTIAGIIKISSTPKSQFPHFYFNNFNGRESAVNKALDGTTYPG